MPVANAISLPPSSLTVTGIDDRPDGMLISYTYNGSTNSAGPIPRDQIAQFIEQGFDLIRQENNMLALVLAQWSTKDATLTQFNQVIGKTCDLDATNIQPVRIN